jgi:hypothetical protein
VAAFQRIGRGALSIALIVAATLLGITGGVAL